MGEQQLGLGHPDKLDRACCRVRDEERRRIGHADILACADHDAAGDEARVLAGHDHLRHPVEGGVGIRAAHRFDKRAGGVVVLVAVGVVYHGLALDALLGDGAVELDLASRVGRCGPDPDLQSVEAPAGIAFARGGEVAQGFLGDLDPIGPESAFRVRQGPVHEADQVVVRERLQFEDLGAGDEGTVDVEKRVVGGGADEADHAAFDVGQQNVLLGFVEPVDLVDEEDRPGPARPEPVGRRSHDPPDIGHVALHPAEPLEYRSGGPGDDLGECGFPGSGRAVEEDGGDPVGLDRPAQELARTEDVLLPGVFFERAGPHPGAQGCVEIGGRVGRGLEKIAHAGIQPARMPGGRRALLRPG